MVLIALVGFGWVCVEFAVVVTVVLACLRGFGYCAFCWFVSFDAWWFGWFGIVGCLVFGLLMFVGLFILFVRSGLFV